MSTPAKEEPGLPKEEKKEEEQINLVVRSQEGAETHFKIKRATTLKKLIDAYCSRAQINGNSVRFLFEGQRVQDNMTPKDTQ
eukprot:gene14912-17632_t